MRYTIHQMLIYRMQCTVITFFNCFMFRSFMVYRHFTVLDFFDQFFRFMNSVCHFYK